MRLLILLIAVSAALILATLALGRAVDVEAQDRVIFTRDGVTFDCERRFVEGGQPIPFEDGSSVLARGQGEMTYGNCHTVP